MHPLITIPRRRKVRKERTPYYMTGLTVPLQQYILSMAATFETTFGREYEDEDPQFCLTDTKGVGPRPVADPQIERWLNNLAPVMLDTRHHPAHVHAMLATHTIIFGCDDTSPAGACFDLDHCPNCNFRSVPEGWTRAWEQATREYEKWSPNAYGPTMPTTQQALATMAKIRR